MLVLKCSYESFMMFVSLWCKHFVRYMLKCSPQKEMKAGVLISSYPIIAVLLMSGTFTRCVIENVTEYEWYFTSTRLQHANSITHWLVFWEICFLSLVMWIGTEILHSARTTDWLLVTRDNMYAIMLIKLYVDKETQNNRWYVHENRCMLISWSITLE